MRPTTAYRLTPAHPAWRPRAVNGLVSVILVASARLNSRKNKDKSERLVTCFVRVPGMCEARPRYHRNQTVRCTPRVILGRIFALEIRICSPQHPLSGRLCKCRKTEKGEWVERPFRPGAPRFPLGFFCILPLGRYPPFPAPTPASFKRPHHGAGRRRPIAARHEPQQ